MGPESPFARSYENLWKNRFTDNIFVEDTALNSYSFTRGVKSGKSRINEGQTMNDTEYNLRPKTIVIAGSARLPENITAKHVFGYVTIELEIDPVDSTIVDISCTLMPFLGEKILYKALLGNKVDDGIKEAITQLDKRFYSVTKRAVIAAFEDAYRWYKKSLERKATAGGK